MISETMPLNEWPLIKLEQLLVDLKSAKVLYNNAGENYKSTEDFIAIVQCAISDREFEEQVAYQDWADDKNDHEIGG